MSAAAASSDSPASATESFTAPPAAAPSAPNAPQEPPIGGETTVTRDVPPLPAAPVKRRQHASTSSKPTQQPRPAPPPSQLKRSTSASSTAPRYLAPTAAAAARCRTGPFTNAASKTETVQAAALAADSGRSAARSPLHPAPASTASTQYAIIASDAKAGSADRGTRGLCSTTQSALLDKGFQPSSVGQGLEAPLRATPTPLPSSDPTRFVGQATARATTPTLTEATKAQRRGRLKAAVGTSSPAQRAALRQQQRTRAGASLRPMPAPADAAPPQTPLFAPPTHVAFDLTGEEDEDALTEADGATAEWHTSLRLEAFPSATTASRKVASALADALGSTGVDGELADALLEPTRHTREFAQAALAAERASLLCDAPEGNTRSDDALSATWEAAGQQGEAHASVWSPTLGPPAAAGLSKARLQRAGRRGSATTSAAATSVTPAAVAEFLSVEAQAEAEERQKEMTWRTPADRRRRAPGGASDTQTPPPPSSPSAPAESAAVLRELQAMQHRLQWRDHRSTSTRYSPPPLQQQRKVSPKAGYASSPCDISASSASTSSSSRAASALGESARRHSGQRIVDWTAASITEIVDALDRCSSSSLRFGKQRSRGSQGRRGAASCSGRARRGELAGFSPDVYVHALLEGSVGASDELSSCSSLASEDARGVAERRHAGGPWAEAAPSSARRSHSPAADLSLPPPSSLTPRDLRQEALLRAGPSWAAAAAEVGLTPDEVQSLLRYSLNAPEAAVWLSGRTHADTHRDTAAPSTEKKHRAEGGVDPQPRAAARPSPPGSMDGHDEDADFKQRRRPQPPLSYALDAATQTAIVHRLISALPPVPAALKEEMARQRMLLEGVTREVRAALAHGHTVARDRLASPTASSLARQPVPIELQTSEAAPSDWRRDPALPSEGEQARAYEALLLASLPRSAADPSRPLPPFHSVIARPSLSRRLHPPSSPPPLSHGGVAEASAPYSLPQQQQQQAYGTALHELAERQTQHYASELDRLRTVYDRQLAEERRQRGQERQQYAGLLERQQQKMLQHHRETVRLLQRETRLQQEQLDSLVQQLAASQAAAAQRQQGDHESATRRMLLGAVEVMKSHCVPAAAMDAYVGQQQLGNLKASARGRRPSLTPTRAAAAKLARARRIREFTDAATGARAPPAPPSAVNPKEVEGAATAARDGSRTPSNARGPAAEMDEYSEAAAEARMRARQEEVPPQPLDASCPTSADLTQLRQKDEPQQHRSATHPAAGGESAAEDDREAPPTPHGGTPAGVERQHVAPSETAGSSPTSTTVTAVDRHSSPPPPLPVSAPKLQLNSAEVLRSVYGGTRSPNTKGTRATQESEAAAASSAVSRRHQAPPTRMALPLRVSLPPEDALDVHVRRVEAAKAAVDARATEAAVKAGLAVGTLLYAAPPRRRTARRRSDTAVELSDRAARSATAPPAGRGRGASAAAGVSQQRSRSAAGGARGGGYGGGRTRKTRPQQLHQRPPWRRTAGAPANDSHGRSFDLELVTALSAEAELTCQSQHPSQPSPMPLDCGYPSDARYPYALPQPQPHQHMYGGVWSEGRPTQTAGGAPQASLPVNARADAEMIAGRPCVGPPVLVLSDPVARIRPAHELAAETTAPPQETAAAPSVVAALSSANLTSAAAYTQLLNTQLRLAQRQRDCAIAELRDATAQLEAQRTTSPPTREDEVASVGALPPCDAYFFGAPVDVIIASDDDATAVGTCVKAAVTSARTTDYAQAWRRLERAECNVESAAAALAAEDAGVLEAVAREDHRRRGLLMHPPPPAAGHSAPATSTINLPRQDSRRAGVRYREQQLGYHAEGSEGHGTEATTAGSGGIYVSARMVDEAHALTAARRRLAEIRACFVSPPLFQQSTPACVGGAAPAAVSALTSAMGADVSWEQRLACETVLSLLEAEGNAQRDPVRQVVAAMEHELLRLVLEAELFDGRGGQTIPRNGAGAPPPKSVAAAAPKRIEFKALDPTLLMALVEETLEDVVQNALQRRSCSSSSSSGGATQVTEGQQQQQQPCASAEDHEREAVAQESQSCAEATVERAAFGDTALQDAEAPREHVALPVLPSTAWLHDAPKTAEAAAVNDAHTRCKDSTAVATATIVVHLQGARVPSAAPSSDAAAAPPELRVSLDLSPVARQLLSPPSAAAAETTTARRLLQGPWSSSSYPPIQQEQLPSGRMLLEDRRDVIVESEVRWTPQRRDEAVQLAKAATRVDALLPVLPPPSTNAPREEATAADAAHAEHDMPGGGERDLRPLLQPLPPPLPPPPPAAPAAPTVLHAALPATPTPFGFTEGLASVPSAPPPTPQSAASTSLLFGVLLSNFKDQEAMQRAALIDREEEQRQSLLRLRSVVTQKCVRRSSRSAEPEAVRASNQSQERAAPTAAAAAPPPAAPTSAPADAARSALPPALPRVRDPVMSAVLEWVYQFGSSRQGLSPQQHRAGRAALATSALVGQLQSAATTAAGGISGPDNTPWNADDAQWVDGCGVLPSEQLEAARDLHSAAELGNTRAADTGAHLPQRRRAQASVSHPSTRNLGSSGASSATSDTTSAPTTNSPSLPSSFRTNSSSSLTEANAEAGIARVDRQPRAAKRVRPILDTQQFPRRRGGSADPHRSAPQSGSSDTATTRYTTSTSSDGHPEKTSPKDSEAQPRSRQRDDDQRSSREAATSAGAMTSAVLPQRVSEEVQDALMAALRAHRRAAAAASYDEQQQQEQEQGTMVSMNGVPDASAAYWPESSQYAVTLPAHSAENTRMLPPPSPSYSPPDGKGPAWKEQGSVSPPRRSPVKAAAAVQLTAAGSHHRSDIPPASPPAQWDAYSLTSASTSTHGSDHLYSNGRGAVRPGEDPVYVSRARPHRTPAATTPASWQ
ncbi:hypothetical protein ABL78_7475 [Leptomonas seymouri]|uniref:Uncharacterized protein n=1 Tax=Leptomonas seymouri TaxID=5684 RepID=A0A0N1I0J6_LEPSE|nr:hypothetical protein ABL78_7475 [Leptomonas seymouri]|eukprot:KPI83488.1 hypothetical protein ABL78_7475 [Leptomonas seymouri]